VGNSPLPAAAALSLAADLETRARAMSILAPTAQRTEILADVDVFLGSPERSNTFEAEPGSPANRAMMPADEFYPAVSWLSPGRAGSGRGHDGTGTDSRN
jgi:hypothetical protein